MKIYLIRHGETDWNLQGRLQGREDIALNDNGIHQAKRCGQAFKDKEIKAVITSPLIRAKKTAEIISENISVDHFIVEEALIERDFGAIAGLTFDKRKHFDTFGKDEGIEPWEKLSKRLMDCIDQYAMIYPQDEIIMVSHGAAINTILAVLSNGEIGSGKTRLKNACISILECKNEKIYLRDYNLTAQEFEAYQEK
ncbi:histidine phosphatase family protein [Mobilitalea sibirica]|uniref:Histidine phosphatase family protein n=1 Tax=Mobilitalea sibirica TaxID=1462919 RepID=A0A8J7KVT8_9FIRM|nr:histidine phosphatase family protein [Mobilitalea sibirica]MBH1940540.1 histidine phosphatase family protein [Mobilitalea sibirica]